MIIKSKGEAFIKLVIFSFILSDLAISVEQLESFITSGEFSRSQFLVYAQKVTKEFDKKEIDSYTKIKNQGFLIDIMFRKDEIDIFYLVYIHFVCSILCWNICEFHLKVY